jgi:ubiquinone/menaquinone biosynthesis C-methylase UbiE
MIAERLPAQEEAVNLRTYGIPSVASYYAALNYLTPCEKLLFQTYVKPGMRVLDLGVGGGRTTAYLSRIASRYVGVDYSEAMVQACRKKFPHLDFRLADASELSSFKDGSFDAIVFSFNGLDSVIPNEKRSRCLRECRRVLRPKGTFIFSSHNPRSVLVRVDWDSGRLKAFTRRFRQRALVCFPLIVAALTAAKATHAFFSAAIRSLVKTIRYVPSSAFWCGQGNLHDPSHGGLIIHCAIPEQVIAELSEFDFELVTFRGDDYPRTSRAFFTDWYYYVFSKSEKSTIGRKSCA